MKAEATNMAKAFPGVKKIKICYEVESDEWWVILYQDIGTAIDLKQFVWNRENQVLEPFLVLKQIPRTQLQEHLSKKEKGRACETRDAPPSRR